MNTMASDYLQNRTFQAHIYGDLIDEHFHVWKVPDLWDYAESLPTESVEVESLVSEIDRTRWFNPTLPPTIRRIVKHCIKIQHADLSYPILIGPNGQVIDGSHRLAKALLEGHKTIKAIRLDTLPPPDLVADSVVEGVEAMKQKLQHELRPTSEPQPIPS